MLVGDGGAPGQRDRAAGLLGGGAGHDQQGPGGLGVVVEVLALGVQGVARLLGHGVQLGPRGRRDHRRQQALDEGAEEISTDSARSASRNSTIFRKIILKSR